MRVEGAGTGEVLIAWGLLTPECRLSRQAHKHQAQPGSFHAATACGGNGE